MTQLFIGINHQTNKQTTNKRAGLILSDEIGFVSIQTR